MTAQRQRLSIGFLQRHDRGNEFVPFGQHNDLVVEIGRILSE
jgi:hypothetical protein